MAAIPARFSDSDLKTVWVIFLIKFEFSDHIDIDDKFDDYNQCY